MITCSKLTVVFIGYFAFGRIYKNKTTQLLPKTHYLSKLQFRRSIPKRFHICLLRSPCRESHPQSCSTCLLRILQIQPHNKLHLQLPPTTSLHSRTTHTLTQTHYRTRYRSYQKSAQMAVQRFRPNVPKTFIFVFIHSQSTQQFIFR